MRKSKKQKQKKPKKKHVPAFLSYYCCEGNELKF